MAWFRSTSDKIEDSQALLRAAADLLQHLKMETCWDEISKSYTISRYDPTRSRIPFEKDWYVRPHLDLLVSIACGDSRRLGREVPGDALSRAVREVTKAIAERQEPEPWYRTQAYAKLLKQFERAVRDARLALSRRDGRYFADCEIPELEYQIRAAEIAGRWFPSGDATSACRNYGVSLAPWPTLDSLLEEARSLIDTMRALDAPRSPAATDEIPALSREEVSRVQVAIDCGMVWSTPEPAALALRVIEAGLCKLAPGVVSMWPREDGLFEPIYATEALEERIVSIVSDPAPSAYVVRQKRFLRRYMKGTLAQRADHLLRPESMPMPRTCDLVQYSEWLNALRSEAGLPRLERDDFEDVPRSGLVALATLRHESRRDRAIAVAITREEERLACERAAFAREQSRSSWFIVNGRRVCGACLMDVLLLEPDAPGVDHDASVRSTSEGFVILKTESICDECGTTVFHDFLFS